MKPELSELFRAGRGGPIKVFGVETIPMYTANVMPNTFILVRRVSNIEQPIQGLHIATDGPNLEVIGLRKKDIVIWADNSRAEVPVKVIGRKERLVKFWNCWLAETTEDAWLRNAGIQTEEIESGVRLNCSDGWGEPNFTDFVIEITFHSPGSVENVERG